MKTKYLLLPCTLGFLFFWLACTSSSDEGTCETPAERVINPNGDSELALIMRSLYNLSDSLKIQVNKQQPADFTLLISLLEKMKTAEATDPSVHGEEFNAFTDSILDKLQALGSDSTRMLAFNSYIQACVNCHESFCPGPIKKIQKLHIPVQ